MDSYTRNDKSDLSGMTPDHLRGHLEPKYDGDVDWWDNLKFGIGLPLVLIALVGSAGGALWLLFGALK